MLQTVTAFLEAYGYAVFFGVGFLEFIGAPFAGTAFLVAGGAMVGMAGRPDPFLLVASAAAGGLLADVVLFGLARLGGQRVVDAACGLTSNPGACVLTVKRNLERTGGGYIVVAKFIPGAANLIAPAAFLSGMPLGRFLVRDGLSLLLWAGAYTSVGYVFSDSVEVALAWLSAYVKWVALAGVVLVGAALVWRVRRYRVHREGHADMQPESRPP